MRIIAHRGFKGRYPEMTALAYEKALELPVDGVECDIRLTRDGHLVCLHDRDLMRVGGSPLVVSRSTLAQLRQVNIGTYDSVQHVLTLDDLLDMVLDADRHIYIEPKHPTRAGRMVEEQLAVRLAYRGLLFDEKIHVISFSHQSMRRMADLAPELETFYLRREWEQRYNPRDILLSNPSGTGLSIERAKRNPELIGAHAKPTYIYTVNTPEDLEFCREHGVDVITTDFPDMALGKDSKLP